MEDGSRVGGRAREDTESWYKRLRSEAMDTGCWSEGEVGRDVQAGMRHGHYLIKGDPMTRVMNLYVCSESSGNRSVFKHTIVWSALNQCMVDVHGGAHLGRNLRDITDNYRGGLRAMKAEPE